jgi:CPA2 family monovalent cation:H+ antiporter-2
MPTALPPLILANVSAAAESTGLGLMVILFSAAAIATIFRRLKLQIIPGYIIAGAIVGFVAQRFHWSLGDLESISQFATILLLFTIGLQLELGELRRSMVSIIGVGVGSTLTVAAVSWGVGALFGLSEPAALAIGLAMSISSTAILLRVLQERRELHQTHGRLCVGVSIAQDLLSILMLGALPAIAAWAVVDDGAAAGNQRVSQMLLSAGIGTLGVVVMLALGRTVLPWLLGLVADIGSRGMAGRSGFGSRELVLVASAAIALGAAAVTRVLGFSAELGAFLAGLLLAFTPFRTQLAGQFEPLRDLLMAIFFTTVGLLLNVPDIAAMIVPILAGIAVLFVIKIVLIGLFAWGFGSSGPLSALAAIYLGNAGEFSLVLLAAAGRTAPVPILDSAELSAAIAVVVLSLFLSPFAFAYAHQIAQRLQGIGPPGWTRSLREKMQHDAAQAAHAEPSNEVAEKPVLRHVVIAGFGPVGRHLAARLSIQKISYTVIELNPSTVKRQSQLGKSIIYGDVTTPEVLESAGMRHADAFVLTIPDDDASHRAIAIARQLSPGVFIACRTSYLSGAFRAYEAGADHAVVEEVVTADAMEKQIFEKIQERWKPPVAPT